MNPMPMLLDLLVDENQQAVAFDAEYRRMVAEANLVSTPTPLRQAMGRALISLGERIGGMHREAIASIAAERAAKATSLHRAA